MIDNITVNVGTAAPVSVAVSTPAPIVVTFAATQGVQGPEGTPGTDGTNGTDATTFVFTQSAPSALWLIVHNLGRYPSVTVIDSSGSIAEGDITYTDGDTLSVAFSASFSGVAYLN